MVEIRWMIRRDTPSILEMDSITEDELIKHLRARNSIGKVAMLDGEVVGYMLYAYRKQQLRLLRLVVHPSHRRKGIGRQLIERLQTKLNPERLIKILSAVDETNLGGQLFLKAMGFRAVKIEYRSEGAFYVMRYRLKIKAKKGTP
jgi:ribosomal protein S18 acetylase RimI-like enzyme